MAVRLVRYLAQCGVASRRGAAELVRDKLITVNGETTTNVAQGIEPEDQVTFRGRLLCPPAKTAVMIMNKPPGLICSCKDPHNPNTVLDLLPPEFRGRLKPVGRLDKPTTGLLLLTDEGDLAHRLTHPRYGVLKTYNATVRGNLRKDEIEHLRKGVELEDGLTAPAQVRLLDRSKKGGRSTFEITIHEGRNRLVRRMFRAVGSEVLLLKRTAYGPLVLGKMKEGQSRILKKEELDALRKVAGL